MSPYAFISEASSDAALDMVDTIMINDDTFLDETAFQRLVSENTALEPAIKAYKGKIDNYDQLQLDTYQAVKSGASKIFRAAIGDDVSGALTMRPRGSKACHDWIQVYCNSDQDKQGELLNLTLHSYITQMDVSDPYYRAHELDLFGHSGDTSHRSDVRFIARFPRVLAYEPVEAFDNVMEGVYRAILPDKFGSIKTTAELQSITSDKDTFDTWARSAARKLTEKVQQQLTTSAGDGVNPELASQRFRRLRYIPRYDLDKLEVVLIPSDATSSESRLELRELMRDRSSFSIPLSSVHSSE